MSARRIAVLTFLFVGLALTIAGPVGAQTGMIWGMDSWFAVGDTLQFTGDAHTSIPSAVGCGGWDSDCLIDRGFLFRKVDHVVPGNCTWSGYDTTCYIVKVLCCFWVGACTSGIEAVCGDNCVDHPTDCPANCYGMSIWRITNKVTDLTGHACYALSLICDPDVDCVHDAECSQKIMYR